MAEYNASVHGDVDIIFAGGGTAACVAAGRIAKHNPDLKILLIERGGTSFEDPAVRNPFLYLTNLLPTSKNAIFWKSQANKHLNGREAVVPTGGTLGGGSAINFMMYTRAQKVDFDSWNTPGWSGDDLVPLANKIETYLNDDPAVDQSKHGHDGPIQVSDGGFRSKCEHDYIATIKKMGKEEIIDMESFGETGGFARWQRYVSKDGKRQDAAFTYLYPLVEGGQHPNLFIRPNSQVVRVLFDGTRASGVEYIASAEADSASPARTAVKATKLVVVSAGALGTPLILERSGVGNPELLNKLNIPVVSAVPGVGEDYQDHHLTLFPFKTSLHPDETLDSVLSGRLDATQLIKDKHPIVGWNGIDVAAKIQMTPEEVAAQPEAFQKLWHRDFAHEKSKPLMLIGKVSAFLGDPTTVEPGQYFTLGCYTAYPWSRGSIHTNSADAINDYTFDNGFFSDESDVTSQIWSYKVAREIALRLPYSTGELAVAHPVFKQGSKAVRTDEDYKSTADKQDVEYSAEDDKVIDAFVRENVNTTWHSLGTCPMKPLDKGGVVDGSLSVFGTQGLKCVDLSIVPENVGANTNNTALVVGEKAATIIASELGIKI